MSTQAIITQALNNFVFDEYENFSSLKQTATTEFSEMITSGNVNENANGTTDYVVYAPTQMGKTGYMLEACSLAKNSGILIVISVDNKKDQLDQTFERFKDCGMPYYKVNKMNTLSINKTLKKNKSVIIFCLNNASQVSKLNALNNSKITVIHDEGDLVHQTDDEEEVGKTQAAWSTFCHNKVLNRIWVSATPENCSFIRGIQVKNVLRLPTNPDYTPVTHFVEWETKDYHILDEIMKNVNPEDREITLFCTDNKVKCHQSIADNISLILPDCVVIVYNGADSCIIRDRTKTPFGCGISEILSDFEDENVNIIVVGHALLSRGISFCSQGTEGKSYMATRLFYLGENAHAVSLSQRFGRIAGTCRPDLTKRTVYCSREVYANYRGYLDNQVKVLDSECEVDMISALTRIQNKRILSCKLDRVSMKKMNGEYAIKVKEETKETEEDSEYIDKARMLAKKWNSANSIVGKIFRFLMKNEYVSSSVLKRKISQFGSKNQEQMYIHLTRTTKEYNLVFQKKDDIITVKTDIKLYIESL